MTETPIALLVACQDLRSPPQPGTGCAAGDIHPGHGAGPAISCSQWEAVQGGKSVRLETVPELRARGGRGKNGFILTAVSCAMQSRTLGKFTLGAAHPQQCRFAAASHSNPMCAQLLSPTNILWSPGMKHPPFHKKGQCEHLYISGEVLMESCCLVDSAAWRELQSTESTYGGSLSAVLFPRFKHLPFSVRKLYRGKFLYASGSSSLLPGLPE